MAIRILIADDEPIILKGLRKLIPWEKHGLEIVGQAGDGKELEALIQELAPDIVISDINMPHQSGIDILRLINERGMPVKVIFISAYQEFIYAKEALSLGAVDYLIKPIEKCHLEGALEKAMSSIQQAGEESRRKDKLKHLEKKLKTEELQAGLRSLVEGTLSAYSDTYRAIGETIVSPMFTALALTLERLNGGAGRWTEEERKLAEFAVENVLAELIVDTGTGHYFHKNENLMLILSHAEADKPHETARDIQAKINGYLKLDVSIGIGKTVRELGCLRESCLQAEQALRMKYFDGLNKVLVHTEGSPATSVESELYQQGTRIIQGLSRRNWQETLEALDGLLVIIRSATRGNKPLAVATAFSSVLAVVQEILKSGVAIADSGFDIQGLQARLGEYDTFDEMAQGIRDMIEELYQLIDHRTGNRDKMLLARIKRYIEEHYAEELTLESVAAVAHMNPYYFSSFFKKRTSENFKPYVTEVRMRHARTLLTNTDLMMYEISEKVGYNNARHFSDVFKKTYGVLPNEFKQSLRK